VNKKILFVSSNSTSIRSFLQKQIFELSKKNEIYILTKNSKEFSEFINKLDLNITIKNIPIRREINIFFDMLCFIYILYNLIIIKPDLILTLTPKAGLIGSLAGFFSRINIRIHYFTGQVWVTKKNITRFILKLSDKIISKITTDSLTDSALQKKFLEDEGVVKKNYLRVLANGSICGVDTSRFYPNQNYRKDVREKLNISPDTILLLFLGRLNKDKGILDLAEVVNEIILNDNKRVSLLIVGPDEENIKSKIRKICSNTIDKIYFVDFTDIPEKYMSSADIFCLPSYREGFGMAALEAGACALPVITSRIYGLVDAVKENYTGLFHEVKNKGQIKDCILKLVEDEKLRKQLGKQGRERVLEEFEQNYVTKEFVNYIKTL
tara:strand:+ start:490 stop:1629 length:1140 start_codon:yes stop_codon:yes gene_type:complete